MDILFIIPPFYRLLGSHNNSINLGVLYLATVLDRAGVITKVYNADHLNNNEYISQAELFTNGRDFGHNLKSHDSFMEIRDLVRDYDPEYLGITVTSSTIIQAVKIAFIAKRIKKDIKIIVGGPHVTLNNDLIFEYKQIGLFDFCFQSESEYKLVDFFKLRRHLNELIPDIDELPYPDYGLAVNREYINYSPVITARGCPYKCSYCASHTIWQGRVRYRSVENIIGEIEGLLPYTDYIDFIDDTFTINRKRVVKLLEALRELNIRWECDTRIDKIDPEILALMKDAGCIKIKIGVESGSQRILDSIHKKTTTEDIRKVVGWIKSEGIPFAAYYMIGLPGETNDDIKQTVKFAKEIGADYNSLSIYTPYKKASNFLYHQNIELLKDNGISENSINQFLSLAG